MAYKFPVFLLITWIKTVEMFSRENTHLQDYYTGWIRPGQSIEKNELLEEYGYNFRKHNDFETIVNFLRQLTNQNALKSRLEIIGESYEKRPIYAVHITAEGTQNMKNTAPKPLIILECGAHSREWTGIEACIYIIKKLINPDEGDSDCQKILSLYDFIVIPVLNPDGYVYTWTTDRLWRKTRSCHTKNCKCMGMCCGVDLNRNFDVEFCKNGSSTDPCSDIYCGEEAFSESESKALRDLLYKMKPRLLAFFSVHCYGGMWLLPYSKTKSPPPNHDELVRVATAGVEAIKQAKGHDFVIGTASKIGLLSSGTTLDFALGTGKYSYALELRKGEDASGFGIQEMHITSMCAETFAGLKGAILAMKPK